MRKFKKFFNRLKHALTYYARHHFQRRFKSNVFDMLEEIRYENETERINLAKKQAANPDIYGVKIPTRMNPYGEMHKEIFKALIALNRLYNHKGMKKGIPFYKRNILINWENLVKAIHDVNKGKKYPKDQIRNVLNTFITDGIIVLTWVGLKRKEVLYEDRFDSRYIQEKHHKFRIEFSPKFKTRLKWIR